MRSSKKTPASSLWKLLGKFLKRLAPVVPIASWACYFFPALAFGNAVFYFYLAFTIVSGYLCFYQPRSLDEKINRGVYDKGTYAYRFKQFGNILDAIFIGVIVFSLQRLISVMAFSIQTVPLNKLLTASQKANGATQFISMTSVLLAIARYRQKSSSHLIKRFARETLSISDLYDRLYAHNTLSLRLTRTLCDCSVIFYNCFYVATSVASVLLGRHIPQMIQQLIIAKMAVVSGLLSLRIAYDNEKVTSAYLTRKIEAITVLEIDVDGENYSLSRQCMM